MSRKSVGIRRVTACALVVLLCLLIMTGCGSSAEETTPTDSSKGTTPTAPEAVNFEVLKQGGKWSAARITK